DRPTAKILDQTVVYYDSNGNKVDLTAAQIGAFEAAFAINPEDGNTNIGKIDWAYNGPDDPFSLIPDQSFDFLGVGETLTITSTIQIDDHHVGGTINQDVTVTIDGANDAPIAVADTTTVRKGGTVTGNVLVNDKDPDLHDTLHVGTV